jgi:hypothetical protein
MTSPMPIQYNNLSQVSHGRLNICSRQMAAPASGTQGTRGVLNGRWRSGLFFLRITMLMHTMVNASNVPMETSSLRILMGRSPAIKQATTPVIMVVI